MRELSYISLRLVAPGTYVAAHLVLNELGYPQSCRYTEPIALSRERGALLGPDVYKYLRDELALAALFPKGSRGWHFVADQQLIEDCKYRLIYITRIDDITQMPADDSVEYSPNDYALRAGVSSYRLRSSRPMPPAEEMLRILDSRAQRFDLAEPLERLRHFIDLKYDSIRHVKGDE
jgi:hypothetical protein